MSDISEMSLSREKMTSYNHSSSYNRTYEKKVLEETPRIRITSHTHAPMIPSHIMQNFASFPSLSLNGSASSSSSVRVTDDSFHATIDVREYAPEELKVSVIGAFIVVEAVQAEKEDDMGLISKSFTRKFRLPPAVQPESVQSSLTSEGMLSIVALPPKPKESSPVRSIPIKVVTSSTPAAPADAQPEEKKEENAV